MELFELATAELLGSNAGRRHPFLYFTLATFGQYPEARTVVARQVSPGLDILFFTDPRSPKVIQIRENPKVSALFYHPKKKLQLRMNGRADIIAEGEDGYDPLLNQVKNSGSLKDYSTRQPPGSVVAKETDIEFVEDLHFLPIRIRPLYIDVLQLGRETHQRRGYTLEKGIWQEAILVP
ncbi:MAG: pyridoxamine 5'-phosphate oxidase family protein [Lewinellaceae bacterium]|nr:pyridoxamine 5'-phosphate oxidase family protein [Lewinellaceae bacterium]